MVEFARKGTMSDKHITFKEISEIEPRILALYKQAKATKDDQSKPSFCANHIWYDMKPVIVALVGDQAKDLRLKSSEAYDVAYGTIYKALPDCRNCACFSLS